MTRLCRWDHAAFAVRFALFGLIAMGAAAAQTPQTSSPTDMPAPQGSAADPHSITIDVSVTDKAGEHIRGLSASVFSKHVSASL